ncbi:hypothetical protein ABB55_17160 [Prosthecomicrobium hirschii]|uniref:Uncharacterized protein n=1 Tax=Prosthecodimorpha hirschii TaxID=665126 RepID=A0A0P6W8X4_9HYPH|nr:hypothetical protein [Prosthecomicrobium hirschii]KPL53728.1 hypothetical protein ABB55_17160 [Prosthecomicrobium hirschii]
MKKRIPTCFAIATLALIAVLGLGAKSSHGNPQAQTCEWSNSEELFRKTVNFKSTDSTVAAPILLPSRTKNVYDSAGYSRSDEIRVAVGDAALVRIELPSKDATTLIYTNGAAQPKVVWSINSPSDFRDAPPPVKLPINTKIDTRSTDAIVVRLDAPNIVALTEPWQLVAALCNGTTNTLIGYTIIDVEVVKPLYAWAASLAALGLFWSLISFAAWRLNKTKIDKLINPADDGNYPLPLTLGTFMHRIRICADPVFISQNSLGYGSLSRFQILIFSSVVGFVVLYVYIYLGTLPSMSSTILQLLGITALGSTFVRATNDWAGISPATRRLLIGGKLLIISRDKPHLSDLIETHGEIDVAKVQALLFTGLVAVSILGCTAVGLAGFTLPQEIVYLSGISQLAYVAGSVAPSDTRKRLEQDITDFRQKAADRRSKPDDPQAKMAFEQAAALARSTLYETYLDRFDDDEFEAMINDPKLERIA